MPEQISTRSPDTEEDHFPEMKSDSKGISILKKEKERKETRKAQSKVNGFNVEILNKANSLPTKDSGEDHSIVECQSEDHSEEEFHDETPAEVDFRSDEVLNGKESFEMIEGDEINDLLEQNGGPSTQIDDEDSSNIVITPDITDFSTYGNEDEADDDMDDDGADDDLETGEQLDLDSEQANRIHDLCGNGILADEHLTQPNTPLSAERLYSAYSAYSMYSAYQAAAAAAAAAVSSGSNAEHYSNSKISLPQDDHPGCRSLVCDASGVIIAEMVYRCLVCRSIHDSINDAQLHYLSSHAGTDISSSPDSPLNGQMPNLLNTPKPVGGMNLLSQLLRGDSKRIEKWQKMKSMQQKLDFNVLQQQQQQQQQMRQQLRQQAKLAKSKLAQEQRIQHIQQRIQQQQQQRLQLQQQQRWKEIEQQQQHLQQQIKLQSLQQLKKQQKQQQDAKHKTEATKEAGADSMDAFKEQIRMHLRDQLMQSPLAEMLQRGDSSFNNNVDLSLKLAALQQTQSKPQFGESLDNSPQSPEEFNDDEDQMHNFSPQSDLLEHKSDDSSLEQQTQFNAIPELSSLLTSPPKPGTVAKTTPNTPGSSRGGFVTCAVCSITKFYASVQRRYGQFTCMGCAKFFGRFLAKPKKYNCPTLGSCQLNTSPRCKACLLLACINTYTIDEKRKAVINENRPVQKNGPGSQLIGRCSDPATKRKKIKMKPFSIAN